VDTVRQILAMADADARYKKLMSCARRTELEFALENDVTLIDPLVELVQQVIDSQRLFDGTVRVRVGVALEQALHNAMIRGNLAVDRQQTPFASRDFIQNRRKQPEYADRHVYVLVRITNHSAEFVVRDEGAGFDLALVPQPHDPDAFREGVGRGLVLIRTFMDEVEFSNGGREIRMVKFGR
jgi:hypothetical protein